MQGNKDKYDKDTYIILYVCMHPLYISTLPGHFCADNNEKKKIEGSEGKPNNKELDQK